MEGRRHIRSFVLRAGRVTAAQERALEDLWPSFGLEIADSGIDLDAAFGRSAPRCLEIGFGAGEVIGTLAREPIRTSTTSESRCTVRGLAVCCCTPSRPSSPICG